MYPNPTTGTRYKDIRQSFNNACRRAGIVDFRFHDLRHAFAGWAVQSGMDLYRLSRLLGHSTLQMSTRYAHLATEQLHEAVHAMDLCPKITSRRLFTCWHSSSTASQSQ